MTVYALNGLGRIGKLALKPLLEKGAEVAWINDAVGDPQMHAHLLEFDTVHGRWKADFTLVAGLLVFGVVFAVNSSLHSYLILSFTKAERVTMDVGFYYMANAGGRLAGTLLSGLTYQAGGLALMLGAAAGMVVVSAITVGFLKPENG